MMSPDLFDFPPDPFDESDPADAEDVQSLIDEITKDIELDDFDSEDL